MRRVVRPFFDLPNLTRRCRRLDLPPEGVVEVGREVEVEVRVIRLGKTPSSSTVVDSWDFSPSSNSVYPLVGLLKKNENPPPLLVLLLQFLILRLLRAFPIPQYSIYII